MTCEKLLLPVQAPLSVVRLTPSAALPEITGETVFAGARTTPTRLLSCAVEPSSSVAVTTAFKPACSSPFNGVYELSVSPVVTQLSPLASHANHSYAYEMVPLPDHAPSSTVMAWPTIARSSESTGGVLLVGPAGSADARPTGTSSNASIAALDTAAIRARHARRENLNRGHGANSACTVLPRRSGPWFEHPTIERTRDGVDVRFVTRFRGGLRSFGRVMWAEQRGRRSPQGASNSRRC